MSLVILPTAFHPCPSVSRHLSVGRWSSGFCKCFLPPSFRLLLWFLSSGVFWVVAIFWSTIWCCQLDLVVCCGCFPSAWAGENGYSSIVCSVCVSSRLSVGFIKRGGGGGCTFSFLQKIKIQLNTPLWPLQYREYIFIFKQIYKSLHIDLQRPQNALRFS